MMLKYASFMEYISSFLLQYRDHIQRFGRYISVWSLMLGVNLLLVWLLVYFFHLEHLTAISIAFVLESISTFSLQREWTFRSTVGVKKWYMRFVVVWFYSLLLILGVTYVLMHFLSFQYLWARTVSTMVAGLFGYFLDLKITFRV